MHNVNVQVNELLKNISVDPQYVDVDALGRQLDTFSDYKNQISKLNLAGVEPIFSIQQKGFMK